jgi:pimeloyl-ACP methyl ester carboxylesterase
VAHASEIKPEVVFLAGEQDPMSGDHDTEAMAELLPNARLRYLHGVGHAAPLETAEIVAGTIRDSIIVPQHES